GTHAVAALDLQPTDLRIVWGVDVIESREKYRSAGRAIEDESAGAGAIVASAVERIAALEDDAAGEKAVLIVASPRPVAADDPRIPIHHRERAVGDIEIACR